MARSKTGRIYVMDMPRSADDDALRALSLRLRGLSEPEAAKMMGRSRTWLANTISRVREDDLQFCAPDDPAQVERCYP